MATSLDTGFYIVQGTHSQAYATVNGGKISDFPVQSDNRPWVRPGNSSDIISFPKFVDGIGGHRFAYGGYSFSWNLLGLSPLQVKYIKDTYWNNVYSDDFTVQTYNRATGEWEGYNILGKYPDVANEASPALGGYTDFIIQFVNGSRSTVGPDITGSTVLDSKPGDTLIDATVTNNGDDETFDTVTVILTIDPALADFVSTSGTGWTIEYSTDGGSTYSPSPPGTPSDTTNVRYTRSDTLTAGNDYPVIDLRFTETGSSGELEFDISMNGDTDTSNNTFTYSVPT